LHTGILLIDITQVSITLYCLKGIENTVVKAKIVLMQALLLISSNKKLSPNTGCLYLTSKFYSLKRVNSILIEYSSSRLFS
jgi:hypothetical protein